MKNLNGFRRALAAFFEGAALALTAPGLLGATLSTGTAIVRGVPAVNGGGTVEGSIHQMSPGNVTLNGGATITDRLLVPGTPTLKINGKPNFGGVVTGPGSASSSGYQIALNGNARLGALVTRTNPTALPPTPSVLPPQGTRNVTITASGQSAGDFATVKNLTLNGRVGQYSVPPGAYGDLVANGGSGFTLGVAGSTTPAVYDFQKLTLNGQSHLVVVGPVVIRLANGLYELRLRAWDTLHRGAQDTVTVLVAFRQMSLL